MKNLSLLLATFSLSTAVYADTAHSLRDVALRTFEGATAAPDCEKLKKTLDTLNGQEILNGQVVVNPADETAEHKTEFRNGVKIKAKCEAKDAKVNLSVDLDVEKNTSFALGQFFTGSETNLKDCVDAMGALAKLSSRDKVQFNGQCIIGLNFADDELTEIASDDARLEVQIKIVPAQYIVPTQVN